MAEKYVLSIDQGTTSSRAIVFNHAGQIVGSGQKEHEQILPTAGWVEHNAIEIWENIREVVSIALADAQVNMDSLAAVADLKRRCSRIADYWQSLVVVLGRPYYWSAL